MNMQVIAEHLMHEGHFELGNVFIGEAKLKTLPNVAAYMGMEKILQAVSSSSQRH